MVYEAWKQVRGNGGSAGIDGKSLKDFEEDLPNNLYKLWNRLTSGSYFPQAGSQAGRYTKGKWRCSSFGYPHSK